MTLDLHSAVVVGTGTCTVYTLYTVLDLDIRDSCHVSIESTAVLYSSVHVLVRRILPVEFKELDLEFAPSAPQHLPAFPNSKPELLLTSMIKDSGMQHQHCNSSTIRDP